MNDASRFGLSAAGLKHKVPHGACTKKPSAVGLGQPARKKCTTKDFFVVHKVPHGAWTASQTTASPTVRGLRMRVVVVGPSCGFGWRAIVAGPMALAVLGFGPGPMGMTGAVYIVPSDHYWEVI